MPVPRHFFTLCYIFRIWWRRCRDDPASHLAGPIFDHHVGTHVRLAGANAWSRAGAPENARQREHPR